MIEKQETYDLVVCGGGLAGLCTAIAAARGGLKTCLIQDRPVLGGNSSSEIRVTVHGAGQHHHYAREGGILSEMLVEERARNHLDINENGWTNSVWDMVQYDFVQREPNLTLHLNTAVTDLVMDDGQRASDQLADRPPATTEGGYSERPACNSTDRIRAVIARVANAETDLVVSAGQFVDCTGDGLVADLAGCGWRWGSEGVEETGEVHAPPKPSTDTMGNSIHIRARDMGRPCPFTPPDWAVKHTDPGYFYDQGRVPGDPSGGFWWIEIGVPWDTIHDNETIRHELTRHALGIWDWMKNHDPRMKERCRNFALDWIGQVPGKRESRRIYGQTWMTENDIQENRQFEDEVAYGGWFVDLHTPGGLLAPTSEPASAEGYKPDSEYAAKSHVGPYGIPLGIMLSRDIANLAMVGRNVSVTHACLGTVRVMGTCAAMGQALGTAAAIAREKGIPLSDVATSCIHEVQQLLLRDGCWLPNIRHADDKDLARSASLSASSEHAILGAGPADPWASGGLKRHAAEGSVESLERVVGQFIAVDGGPVGSVDMLLRSANSEPVELPVRLRAVDHLWEYGLQAGTVLAEGTVTVRPGDGWTSWKVDLPNVPAGWLRLEAGPAEGLEWQVSPAILPGHVAFFQMSPKKMRYCKNVSTLCYRLDRPQAVCGAVAATSGCTRPQRSVERWISDPAQPMPQHLDLQWADPVRLSSVEITFPGHLMREYHATPAGFRDPQIPRDYRVLVKTESGWKTVAKIHDNFARCAAHRFEELETRSVRIVVDATNGDPSAQISEVRCYA